MKKRIGLFNVLVVLSFTMVACSSGLLIGPTPTPTIPPPTPTPACAFKCNINTQQYGFEITCESGTVTTTSNNESTHYNYATSGQMSGITVGVNRDLLFQNNQHKYHIEGTITVDQLANTVTYDITATGDAFGNTPQTCKQP
jgi:hypothetical protein